MALSIEKCSSDGNGGGIGAGLRSMQEMGLQLRFASERGRMQDVKKLMSEGAPIIRDAVSLIHL